MPRPRGRVRLTEQARRDLIVRQGELTALSQHPGFEVLQMAVEDKVEKLEKIVLAKTLYSDKPIPAEEVYFLRGVISGLRWFARVPTDAEASLEQFLRRQGVDVKEEAS